AASKAIAFISAGDLSNSAISGLSLLKPTKSRCKTPEASSSLSKASDFNISIVCSFDEHSAHACTKLLWRTDAVHVACFWQRMIPMPERNESLMLQKQLCVRLPWNA